MAGQHHGAVLDTPHETKAALALSQFAESRAKVALKPAVVQTVPEPAGHHRKILIHGIYRRIHGYLVFRPYIVDQPGGERRTAA